MAPRTGMTRMNVRRFTVGLPTPGERCVFLAVADRLLAERHSGRRLFTAEIVEETVPDG